jgi:dCTP diphosphatase
MDRLAEISKRIVAFRDARDWKQFHNPKDVALSLVLEATEVMEHFQWKNKEEMEAYTKSHKKEVGEELADVLYWVILMSHDLGIDPIKALQEKMDQNEKKYPVEKAKGRHTKYDKLK